MRPQPKTIVKISVQETASPGTMLRSKDQPSLISNEKLQELHAAMVKCRMLGKRAELLFQQRKPAVDSHGYTGREASATAFVIDLRCEDLLSLSPGDWMPGFVRGAPLETMFQALAAKATGIGHENSLAARGTLAAWNIQGPSTTVRNQLENVCEAAQAMREARSGVIAMAFFPVQPNARNSSREAIALANKRKLPIVFVHHGEATPEAEQPDAAKRSRSAAPETTVFGVPTMVVDGNDAVALYRVACEAIARARQGRGPTVVKSLLSDETASAAPRAECIYKGNKQRMQRDPILTMENYLEGKGLFSEELKNQVVADFTRELDLATRLFSG